MKDVTCVCGLVHTNIQDNELFPIATCNCGNPTLAYFFFCQDCGRDIIVTQCCERVIIRSELMKKLNKYMEEKLNDR
jgi:hypothetical protein